MRRGIVRLQPMAKTSIVAVVCAAMFAAALHGVDFPDAISTGESAILEVAPRPPARLDVREVNGFSIVFEIEHLDGEGTVLSRHLRYLDAYGRGSWDVAGAAVRVYCVNGSGKIVASVGTLPLRRETGRRHSMPATETIAYGAVAAAIAGLWIARSVRHSAA